ncbi:hypothetical protein M0R45_008068 [Rubus argutus]|uniref:Uncharacterized protein n=1 Tax=Rubus argutus TaxID=59490 RepID=A0AAW1Y1Q3_RUBAR
MPSTQTKPTAIRFAKLTKNPSTPCISDQTMTADLHSSRQVPLPSQQQHHNIQPVHSCSNSQFTVFPTSPPQSTTIAHNITNTQRPQTSRLHPNQKHHTGPLPVLTAQPSRALLTSNPTPLPSISSPARLRPRLSSSVGFLHPRRSISLGCPATAAQTKTNPRLHHAATPLLRPY